MPQDEEEALHKLVDSNEDLEFTNSNQKVKCKSTGHEMPTRLHLVREYISGSKYKKTKEWYSFDFSKYAPDIEPHKKMKRHLFCHLTGTVLPMDPAKVETHVGSKRFKTVKKEREDVAKRNTDAKEKRRQIVIKMKKKKMAAAGKEYLPKASSEQVASSAASGEAASKKTGKKKRKAKPEEATPDTKAGGKVAKGKKVPERSLHGLRKKQYADGKEAVTAKAEEPRVAGPPKKKKKKLSA